MTERQRETAIYAGAKSEHELSIWYLGYLAGERDIISMAIDDISNDDRMAKKENDEHYADYSDQGDDMYYVIKEEFKGEDDE